MKRIALLVGAASLLLGATQVMAQAKPSFAGKWTMVPDTAATDAAAAGAGRRGGGRGGFLGMGANPTIAQDAATLTVTSTNQAGAETKNVYKLDGTDSKNSLTTGARAGGAATPIETVSQAKWDANKLVITTNINFNGNAFQTTMALSLDASGNLIVESTNPGRQGGTPTTTKITYKKG